MPRYVFLQEDVSYRLVVKAAILQLQLAPEDVASKGMDMGDELRGESTEKAITLTNAGATAADMQQAQCSACRRLSLMQVIYVDICGHAPRLV